jgi:hypothetical protein
LVFNISKSLFKVHVSRVACIIPFAKLVYLLPSHSAERMPQYFLKKDNSYEPHDAKDRTELLKILYNFVWYAMAHTRDGVVYRYSDTMMLSGNAYYDVKEKVEEAVKQAALIPMTIVEDGDSRLRTLDTCDMDCVESDSGHTNYIVKIRQMEKGLHDERRVSIDLCPMFENFESVPKELEESPGICKRSYSGSYDPPNCLGDLHKWVERCLKAHNHDNDYKTISFKNLDKCHKLWMYVADSVKECGFDAKIWGHGSNKSRALVEVHERVDKRITAKFLVQWFLNPGNYAYFKVEFFKSSCCPARDANMQCKMCGLPIFSSDV